jgi:hypothetical protein
MHDKMAAAVLMGRRGKRGRRKARQKRVRSVVERQSDAILKNESMPPKKVAR